MSFETSVGTSDADSITVMGRDLARELMGRTTLTELAFLVVQRRMPTADETRLFDAVLVSLADHGLTPTVLAARLTHTDAPASPARRSRTWASRARFCADSRYWREPRGCSVTSRKRCEALSGRVSTAR